MRVYTMCSDSHRELLDYWLDSTTVDDEIEPVVYQCNLDTGSGDYNNEAWRSINELGSLVMRSIISENIGCKIGITGVDTIFLKPVISAMDKMLDGYDALFQRERFDEPLINSDITFLNCSERVAAAWERWIESMEEWDGHLPDQNRLMREAFSECAIGLLPIKFSSHSNTGTNNDPVMFHANDTPPPDSVKKKIVQIRAMLGC